MYLFLLALIVLLWLLIPTYTPPKVLEGVLTEEECDYIKKAAEENFKPSTVGGNHEVHKEIRDSETAWLSRDDPVVRRVMERCLKHTDRPVENCEMLQVLRYGAGGFYKPHQDCFMDEPNPRLYTFVMGLSNPDEYEGGYTAFPNCDKMYKLAKGDVLFFNTLDDYGMETEYALHGGTPVTGGRKMICNLWVRKYPFKNYK